jgi:hypothetical protein
MPHSPRKVCTVKQANLFDAQTSNAFELVNICRDDRGARRIGERGDWQINAADGPSGGFERRTNATIPASAGARVQTQLIQKATMAARWTAARKFLESLS